MDRRRVRIVCLSETHRLREDIPYQELIGQPIDDNSAKAASPPPLTLSHELFISVSLPREEAKIDASLAAKSFKKLTLTFDLKLSDLILVYKPFQNVEEAFSFVRLFRQYGH